MALDVCPWWIGRLMVSPIRGWFENPEKLLRPYVREGMTILEPGPGMGFFTLPMARMVGDSGRIIAVDVQPKMLEGLRRRAARAALLPRIEIRLAQRESMGVEDLRGTIDLVAALYVVHEMPAEEAFFREAAEVLKPGGSLLLVEPHGHVKAEKFSHEMHSAWEAGLATSERIMGGHSSVALFAKSA